MQQLTLYNYGQILQEHGELITLIHLIRITPYLAFQLQEFLMVKTTSGWSGVMIQVEIQTIQLIEHFQLTQQTRSHIREQTQLITITIQTIQLHLT